MLGRHLYLSLSWQVVPWESDGEGAYGRQPDDHACYAYRHGLRSRYAF